MASGIHVGDRAPDFTLMSQSGAPIRHVDDALAVVRQLQAEATA